MKELILETKRLILRSLTADDAEAAYLWLSDERVTKYMPYATYTSISDVREWLDSQKEEDNFHFGFVLKENGLLIGSGDIGLNKGFWDFGYNIRYDYWNQGLTTEAAKAMIKYAYDCHGARDFSSNHAIDNEASGRVIEKCGLQFYEYGEYRKFDGSAVFRSKLYRAHLEELRFTL